MFEKIIRKGVLSSITFYKKGISPFLPRSCRFYPTCSEYMFQSVENYGVVHGVKAGMKRIIKCHPFHPGGYDPVENKGVDYKEF